MTSLTLSRKNLLPLWARDVFDTGNFFSPNLFDFDRDMPSLNLAGRIPTVNIVENAKDFKIEMAAPGLEKKDFKINIEDGVLTISAEKNEETKETKENYTRREFSYSNFSRSFSLPENSLSEKIEAKYENGILKLTLPKKDVAVAKPAKEIKVF